MTTKTNDLELLENLEESLHLRLILVGDRLRRIRDEVCKEFGISTQQWIFLLHVAKDPNIPFFDGSNHEKPMMPKEVAETFGTSRSNITALMTIMDVKGYIRQKTDKIDKRRKRLTLTKKGEKLLSDMNVRKEEMNNDFFGKITKKQKETALKFLNDFIGLNMTPKKEA